MDTRREFLKKSAMLSGAAGFFTLPASIQKALAINPDPGTTFLNAEHIVFLMQENRSFDHCFGTLQGVRGFNDPRAVRQPDNNLVWMQKNAVGETYAPFRLDIKRTKITWMGSLPHSWDNQVDARNNGRYDKWLDSKTSGHEEYAKMPLTMGYYTREDIPFYYALADAFTVCDQHFCSSLTGTTPNRLYFWTGTIRREQNDQSKANVWNEDTDYNTMADWRTFPELLEDNGISWKIYQNDISVDGGFTGEEDAWMANYTDNPIEFFAQYNVKLSNRYINYLEKQERILPDEISKIENQLGSLVSPLSEREKLQQQLEKKRLLLKKILEEKKIWTREKYEALPQREKDLHEKAFTNNAGDPEFYQLTTLQYQDGNKQREITIPRGDVLHQFREDVKNGTLPTVSWLVAPENFSDHPSSAWFGAWYVSEVLDILTKNPEVWKKTIFVLTYDENDGYFDHVPPFVAPDPRNPATGKTSAGIDAAVEFVGMEDEREKKNNAADRMRESPIGLGYRVPLIIVSPWSRGGMVCSQVFDHTSSLQFLEKFLNEKMAKNIRETNISSWRRAVCGDLSAVFQPYNGEAIKSPSFIERDEFIEGIHKAKFRSVPSGYKPLSTDDVKQANSDPFSSPYLPKQEKGTRPSCVLPYELYAEGKLTAGKKNFSIVLKAGNNIFGDRSAGSPFTVYARNTLKEGGLYVRSYAVAPGESLTDEWPLTDFKDGRYHLCVYGPNGFFREFKGDRNDPGAEMETKYRRDATGKYLSPTLHVLVSNPGKTQFKLTDHSYKTGEQALSADNNPVSMELDFSKSHGWYDFSITSRDNAVYEKRYAGHIETGKISRTDPAMGG